MSHLSSSNKKILYESIESQKARILTSVQKMIQKSKFPQYSLDDQFKNLEDPLSYNRSKKIQELKNEAFYTSKRLHSDMSEIQKLSRQSYKKVFTPENGYYDFDDLLTRIHNRDEALSDGQFYEKLRARSQKMKKVEVQDLFQKLRHINHPLKDISNLLAKEDQFLRAKKVVRNDVENYSSGKVPLRYEHIKNLDKDGYDQQLSNVEFYDILKGRASANHAPYVSEFNINNSRSIRNSAMNINIKLIQKSEEFGWLSNELFFDYHENLTFWKGDQHRQQNHQRNPQEQKTMREYLDFRIERISANDLFKFGMRKITPRTFEEHKILKKAHKQREKEFDSRNEALAEKYHKLKEEYDAVRLARRAIRQATAVKVEQSEAQTISQLKVNQFDDYFAQDTKVILQRLGKLYVIREKILKEQKQTNKIVKVRNICEDVKTLLLRLLLMMFKGEKFYSQKGFQTFGFSELMFMQSTQQVQQRILAFISGNLDKFEVEQVDGVAKSDLIRIYAEERDKNSKILQIINRR